MKEISNSDYPQLNKAAAAYLEEGRKWAKFLAIMGFVGTGLMVIVGLFMGTIFSAIPYDDIPGFAGGMGSVMSFIYILAALLYFFPSLYLYNFAEKTKSALLNKDDNQLAEALKNQKSCYKFIGIMTIIIIGLYILMAFFGLLAAMMSF